MKKVGIVMGSDSDLPIIRKTTDTLTSLEIPFEVHVYSAHRHLQVNRTKATEYIYVSFSLNFYDFCNEVIFISTHHLYCNELTDK